MFSRLKTRTFLSVHNVCCKLETPTESQFTVFIRGRKNWRLPKSKTKIFYVRKPTPKVPWETEYLTDAYFKYRETTKSIMKLFKEEVQAVNYAGESQEENIKQEREEHEKCMDINRKWNEEIALMRNEREVTRQKEREETFFLKLDALEEKRRTDRLQAEEEVKLTKEMAKNYISIENIEEEIEKALDNAVDYNFALDLDGNIHKPSSHISAKDKPEQILSAKS